MKPVVYLTIFFSATFIVHQITADADQDFEEERSNCTTENFPFLVAILCKKNNKAPEVVCGGTIMKPEWVLTSAYCCEGHSASMFTIQYALHDQNGTMTVSYLHLHPKFTGRVDQQNRMNDIALMQLSGSLSFADNIDFAPIPINNKRVDAPCETSMIMGWISEDMKSPTLDDLQCDLGVPVTSLPQCRADMHKINKTKIRVLDHLRSAICVKSKICGLDSGSPLLCDNGVQYGVLTLGNLYCDAGSPMIFTRVDHHTRWILKTMLQYSRQKRSNSQVENETDDAVHQGISLYLIIYSCLLCVTYFYWK